VAAEKSLEQKLRVYAKTRGCLFLKWVSPGTDGVPDRIVIGPSGRVCFMEVKRMGGRCTPLQLAMHNMLRAHGVEVHVVDDFEQGKAILDAVSQRA
jgi:hypothetical protein